MRITTGQKKVWVFFFFTKAPLIKHWLLPEHLSFSIRLAIIFIQYRWINLFARWTVQKKDLYIFILIFGFFFLLFLLCSFHVFLCDSISFNYKKKTERTLRMVFILLYFFYFLFADISSISFGALLHYCNGFILHKVIKIIVFSIEE